MSARKLTKESSSDLSLGSSFSSGVLQKIGEVTLDSFYDDAALKNMVATDESLNAIEKVQSEAEDTSRVKAEQDEEVSKPESNPAPPKRANSSFTAEFLSTKRDPSLLEKMGSLTMESFYDYDALDDVIASASNEEKMPQSILRSKQQQKPARDTSHRIRWSSFDSHCTHDTKQLSNTRSSIITVKTSNRSPSPDTDDIGVYDAYDVLNNPRKMQENIIENLRNQLLELAIEKNAQAKQMEEMQLQHKKVENQMKIKEDNQGAELAHWIKRCSSLKVQVIRLENQVEAAAKANEAETNQESKDEDTTPERKQLYPDRPQTKQESKDEDTAPQRKQLDPDGQCAADEVNELKINYNKKLQQLNSHIAMLNSEVDFWKHEHNEVKSQYESLLSIGAKLENELLQSKQVVVSMQKQIEKLTRALALKEKHLKSQKRNLIADTSKKNVNFHMPSGPVMKLSLKDIKHASSRNSFTKMSKILQTSPPRNHHTTNNQSNQHKTLSDRNTDYRKVCVSPTKKAEFKQVKSILKQPSDKTMSTRKAVPEESLTDRSILSRDQATLDALHRSMSLYDDDISSPSVLLKPANARNRCSSDEDLAPATSAPRKSFDVRRLENSPSPPKTASPTRTNVTNTSSVQHSVHSDSSSSNDSQESSSSTSSSSSSSSSSTSPEGSFELVQSPKKPALRAQNNNSGVQTSQKPLPPILKSPKQSPPKSPRTLSAQSPLSVRMDSHEAYENDLSQWADESICYPGVCEAMKADNQNTTRRRNAGDDLKPAQLKPRSSFNQRIFDNWDASSVTDPTKSITSCETDDITSDSSSSSDDTSASTSSGSSDCSFYSMPHQNSMTTCTVSHMPYKEKNSGVHGLYSGQIDIATKLPNGFGALKCTNVHSGECDAHRGEWKMGFLMGFL